MEEAKAKKPRKPRSPVEVLRHWKCDGYSYEDATHEQRHPRHVCLKHQVQEMYGEVVFGLLDVCIMLNNTTGDDIASVLHSLMLGHFQRRRISDIAELTATRLVIRDDGSPMIKIFYDVRDEVIEDKDVYEDIMRAVIIEDIREHINEPVYIAEDSPQYSPQQECAVEDSVCAEGGDDKYEDSWNSSDDD